MPRTKLQNIVFTIIMAVIMGYGMIVYNVALNTGGVTNQTFLMALHELPIMAPIAFVLEFFVVEKLATKLAFTFMRPTMSLIATLLFKGGIQPGVLSTWIQTTFLNFPMALIWQFFFAGPLVRRIFGLLFREKNRG